jgi:nicotinamidase-related amidase
MALTQIDPIAALVVIDLQKGIAGIPVQPHAAVDVIARAARLAAAFRKKSWPVVLVNVAGRAPGRTDAPFNFTPPPDWMELVPELDRQPSDHTVTKFQIGAFYGTALDGILRRSGATQIFFTGIATSMGVEASARTAYDRGYNVVLIEDAMSDLSAESHKHSVETSFTRIGEVTTTADVLGRILDN